MEDKKQVELDDLIQLARSLGASDARVISTSGISVEDDLAGLCKEPQCPNYGLSANCPPHTAGPDGFRKLLEGYEQALLFKIEVPAEALFSDERPEIFRLLHEIAARVEQLAAQSGYAHSRAFAGGSCKASFCRNYPECRVLGEKGACRNPGLARPSMSGFGINVSKLVQLAGWTLSWSSRSAKGGTISMGTVCGLVLIG